ncbi:MAG: winged helix-turn-helix transcriptional regulator [bacterium]
MSVIQQTIIEYILKNPAISKKILQQEGNLTKKAVDYNINKLKEKGLIKRVGPDKGGHWLVLSLPEGRDKK